MVQFTTLAAIAAASFYPVHGLSLDVTSPDSIKSAASTIAANVVSYYNNHQQAYAWWEVGLIADGLIQYEELTGDTKYNHIVVEIIKAQEGPKLDFLTTNAVTVGNDIRGLWALAAISGARAELHFPGSAAVWLKLAETVFDEFTDSWDNSTCNGGLVVERPPPNGTTIKSAASNGVFFDLGARLVFSAGKLVDVKWITRAFDWTLAIGLIDGKSWAVYDVVEVSDNCTAVDKSQWTYNAGLYISGAAHMYNVTNGTDQARWKTVLDGLVDTAIVTFFPNGIVTELCEASGKCTSEFAEFKGIFARALVDALRVAPYLTAKILPALTSSAQAAAKSCTGGPNGTSCPSFWHKAAAKDFAITLGADLSALSYVQALLMNQPPAPTTDTLSLGNETATGTSGSGPSSTASGSATPSASHNAGFALNAEVASVGVWTGMIGMAAWLML